jgi:hypothetical protein
MPNLQQQLLRGILRMRVNLDPQLQWDGDQHCWKIQRGYALLQPLLIAQSLQ